MTIKCKKHPRYKVLKHPTGNCRQCWKIWSQKKLIECLEDIADGIDTEILIDRLCDIQGYLRHGKENK